jgi:hypothetical protein
VTGAPLVRSVRKDALMTPVFDMTFPFICSRHRITL